MITATFLGPDQRDHVIGQIQALDATKSWTLTVKQFRPKRSLSQNNLFHSWVQIIADSTGNEPNDVKSALKDLYLPLKVAKIGKVERMVRPETSSLEVGEMSVFMDRVQAFAATELGIHLPVPSEF